MSRVIEVALSVEVPVIRDTRSYFWLLMAVTLKVSSKSCESAMVCRRWGEWSGVFSDCEANRDGLLGLSYVSLKSPAAVEFWGTNFFKRKWMNATGGKTWQRLILGNEAPHDPHRLPQRRSDVILVGADILSVRCAAKITSTRAAVAIHLPRYRGKCRPAQRVGPTSTSDLPRHPNTINILIIYY